MPPILNTTPFSPPPPVVWDVSGAAINNSYSFGFASSLPEDSWWSTNGDYLYVVDTADANHKVWRIATSIPFDVAGMVAGVSDQNLTLDPSLNNGDDRANGLTFSQNGEHMYVSDKENPSQLHTWDLSTPFDLTSASNVLPAVKPTGAYGIPLSSLVIGSDGTKMATLETDKARMYTLSTPYSPSAAMIFSSTVTFPGGSVQGFFLNNTGIQVVTVESESPGVYKVNVYSLTTPWDLSTMNSVPTSNVTLPFISDNVVKRISITPDGAMMHLTGGQNDTIYQYTL